MEREKACPDTSVRKAVRGRRAGASQAENPQGTEYRRGTALADWPVVAGKLLLGAVGVEPRGQVIRGWTCSINRAMPGRSRVSELKPTGKPFEISKWEVWEAWEKAKENRGGPGVDGVTIEDSEKDLKNNLYRIWNRMSSGSYFPPPVQAVEIPKQHGDGVRTLGIPCVGDRVAQTVVAAHLEKRVELVFHPDSYGYRPGKSALDAVETCRRWCWKKDWVIDLDVQKFLRLRSVGPRRQGCGGAH